MVGCDAQQDPLTPCPPLEVLPDFDGVGDVRAMFIFRICRSRLDQLGGSALYLLSDLSGGVTGEVHFVDSGYNIISMPHPDELKGG